MWPPSIGGTTLVALYMCYLYVDTLLFLSFTTCVSGIHFNGLSTALSDKIMIS